MKPSSLLLLVAALAATLGARPVQGSGTSLRLLIQALTSIDQIVLSSVTYQGGRSPGTPKRDTIILPRTQ